MPFPKGNFANGNFPDGNFPSGNFPMVILGSLRRRQLQWGPNAVVCIRLRGWALQLWQTWEVTAWEIGHLGSFHLRKYPWEAATWKKSIEKVSNIMWVNLKSFFCCFCGHSVTLYLPADVQRGCEMNWQTDNKTETKY